MKYLLILIGLLSLQTSAQQLTDFKVPTGYTKVIEAKGDLDKDGIEEVVLAYNTNKPDGILGFFRVLYICKLEGGKLKLWKKNNSILRSSKQCGFCVDEGINLSLVIKNNTLTVSQTFNYNTRHYGTNKNVFRFQNEDWYLIGSTFNDYDTCAFDFKYDINFSTKQVSVAYTFGDCDEGKEIPEDKIYNFKYPFTSIPKMDGFNPGKAEHKIPNSKSFFYY